MKSAKNKNEAVIQAQREEHAILTKVSGKSGYLTAMAHKFSSLKKEGEKQTCSLSGGKA